jgi:hypothetical protein
MLDIKLDKLRAKDVTGRGEISEKSLKKAEVVKCNEYCKLGLMAMAHFTYLYAHNKDRNAQNDIKHLEKLELHEVALSGCIEPDESKKCVV